MYSQHLRGPPVQHQFDNFHYGGGMNSPFFKSTFLPPPEFMVCSPPPVQPHHTTTVIIINQPMYYPPMQRLQNHHLPSMKAPVYYNDCFSTPPRSRPIRVNAPPVRLAAGCYELSDRVKGLAFDHPTSTTTRSSSKSVYLMDFMDFNDVDVKSEQPHASSSHSLYSHSTDDTIEESLRRVFLSDGDDADKKKVVHSPLLKSNISTKRTTASNDSHMPQMIVAGEPGFRSFKRGSSAECDEIESEVGLKRFRCD